MELYILIIGITFFILGTGLMLQSICGTGSIGLMVFCKILFSSGCGTIYPLEQLAIMVISPEHTAALMAAQGVAVDSGKAATYISAASPPIQAASPRRTLPLQQHTRALSG